MEGLNFCAETLDCLPRIKAIHPDLKTTIGVGNLTNGLGQKPYMRKVLTSVFLDEAQKVGLDCAILNPNHYVPLDSLPQHDVWIWPERSFCIETWKPSKNSKKSR